MMAQPSRHRGTPEAGGWRIAISITGMPLFFVSVSRPTLLEWGEDVSPVSTYEIEAADNHAAATAAVGLWQQEQQATDEPGHVSVQRIEESR
jgi:hypothetical protein